ncbi:MAG: prepilin-type N-terminal cleavage/methylation domain-containing protein [Cyanobacteria bacterium]|nr:prepilin-type N-terminal cleavage/methylation domain-containing protein [Cyanobacteriota bacterium]
MIKALTATLRSAGTNSAAQHGFTLVELLVGVALGSILMSGLGALMMLSEVRVSANIQRNLDVKDSINRATDLMRREATLSSVIEAGSPFLPVGGTALDDCEGATPIRFTQRSNVNHICYKAVAATDLPAVYQPIYKGPCVLVRLGPPYKPNGDLDGSAASSSAVSNVQVLIDGLAKPRSSCGSPSGAFRVSLGSRLVTSPTTEPIRRNADITITMASPPVSYGFSVRSASNPAYDGNALYDKCTTLSELGCAAQEDFVTYHYKPFMNSTTESIDNTKPSKENLFYFKYPFIEYVLSGDSGTGFCSYKQCYVSRNGAAVKMKNVDGLIFADKEIRVFDTP